MTSRDEIVFERSRHQLGRLMGTVLGALEDAELLLKPKALRSPASAEADAWRRIVKAKLAVLSWAQTAGPTVGVNGPELEALSNGQATAQSSGA